MISKRLATRLGGALIVLGLLLSGATATGGAAVAQPDPPLKMVALGDSAAAGPLIPEQVRWDCLRSNQNWPNLVAQQLGATLTDVSCSGAFVSDLTGRRFGYMPPQVDAVEADTDVVTLTIGANDLNLGGIIPSCANPLPPPFGISCKIWQPEISTTQITKLTSRLTAAVRAVQAKAPNARILLVSYLKYWGTSGSGCYPHDPVWPVDAAWLQSIFDRVNATLAAVATTTGEEYVDLAGPSSAHGICATGEDKWMEGLIPTSIAAPYHANATGTRAVAPIIAAAID